MALGAASASQKTDVEMIVFFAIMLHKVKHFPELKIAKKFKRAYPINFTKLSSRITFVSRVFVENFVSNHTFVALFRIKMTIFYGDKTHLYNRYAHLNNLVVEPYNLLRLNNFNN